MIWVPFLGMASFNALCALGAWDAIKRKATDEAIAWTCVGIFVLWVLNEYRMGM